MLAAAHVTVTFADVTVTFAPEVLKARPLNLAVTLCIESGWLTGARIVALDLLYAGVICSV